MRALLVGAGAVGQVYGRHLQLGGAELGFLVREKYADEARRGFTMYRLRGRRGKVRREQVDFRGFRVFTTTEEAGAFRPDQVWLCVSSTAMQGEWLPELLAAVGNATVVLLQPGLKDEELVLRHCSRERLVRGVITMVSYPGPLPGETLPRPGVEYWFPPLTSSPFSGPSDRVKPVVEALKKGGCRASAVRDVGRVAYGTALMMPTLLALEAEGWSLERLRKGRLLRLASEASAQAIAAVATYRGEKRPWILGVAKPPLLKLALGLGPKLVPFDLEEYLKLHFTKVGDQTRAMVETYVQVARQHGLSTSALEELNQKAASQGAN